MHKFHWVHKVHKSYSRQRKRLSKTGTRSLIIAAKTRLAASDKKIEALSQSTIADAVFRIRVAQKHEAQGRQAKTWSHLRR